ncbi:YfhO family protein [Candidatus Enterococcus mansonii]|uniref:ABC transporter permease n=1 Tax=Candidatus Enterococcus mansonii TaxID=1834181 RepID=A0A242CFN8_9ENTE|nr:YfhO family protein [Enterococcus sp. 4G2_DIV0659]OTO08740.1 hypothetical protein A5880_001740 [Enterococcus sp. 4G2_DIV0659]
MIRKIKEFGKQHFFFVLLSFSIPVAAMCIAYYNIGIYPGSTTSILASDGFSQYANFHSSFKHVLDGKQSIFYTWSGSLGLNYWALSAYYLNGIFTPLVAFFDNSNMTDTLYYLTLIKFGTIGVSFWIFAHHTFKINRWIVVALSVSYTLMSYAVAYSEVIMWLDTFVYLPLVVLGIHRLMDKRKPTLLFISYLMLFVSNFYMAFMVGVFSFLYFFARSLTNWSTYKKTVWQYLITSFLAGGASMIVILPTVIDLATNGESLSGIGSFFTNDIGAWDLVAKNLVGVYDTSKYKSMPFIYIGLIPLIFSLYYFVNKKFALKDKCIYGSLILIVCASFYINALNLFWHGMHGPYMFLFRFSFLLSFMVILLAGYSLEHFSKEDINGIINVILSLMFLFLVFIFFSNKKRYGLITTESLILTIVLLGAYLLIWLIIAYKPKWERIATAILVVFMVLEAAFNAQQMIIGIKNDWSYLSEESYNANYEDIKRLVSQTEENESFFRMENLNGSSQNDSFRYGYHGVSMFSSIRNRHSSQYINLLGYRSFGTNLLVDYKNNTLLADSLIGMKYNLSSSDSFNKFGYEEVGKSGDFTLYENQYALPLGILTDDEIYEKEAVKNQTELFNHFSGTAGEIYTFGDAPIIASKDVTITETGETIELGETELGHTRTLKFLITVPAGNQGYLSIVPTDLFREGKTNVSVKINGKESGGNSSFVNTGQYHDLGYHKNTTTLEVECSFTGGNQTIEIFRPDAVFLDTKKFAEDVEKIKEQGVDFQIDGRRATANIDSEEAKVLLTTIPYDKGWSAFIDGEKVEVKPFKDAFLSVDIPKGQHTLELVFLPQGFVIGTMLFISCIVLFILYSYWYYKKRGQLSDKETITNA